MIVDKEYHVLFESLKKRVVSSQYRAALKANTELILLYHYIGNAILDSQKKEGWGAKIITQLSKDLKLEFPKMKGFSLQNLKYMRKFAEKYTQNEIEKGLMKHIEKFLLELGEGFAFIGNQYHLEIADQDFYIDMLFYHIKLRSFVVIELKSGKFKPEYTGKLNFYLSAVDDLLKQPEDNPSIGLILCKSKNNVLAEYALRDITKPAGLAEYRLEDTLPKEIKTALPTIEELEAELSKQN